MPNHSTNRQDSSSRCVLSPGSNARLYQQAARAAFEIAGDVDLQPHAWVVATCGSQCLNPQHLIAHQPRVIAYPAGVCVYCGFPAGTKDHLVPRPWSGDTRRSSVAVVPACGECNAWIGAAGSASIDDRRKIAHDRLRKARSETLAAPEWAEGDLAELGPVLRQHVEAKQRERKATLARLAWPEDPFYDMRAWQKSGVDDPVAIGVIAPPVGYVPPVPMPTATKTQAAPVDPRLASRERQQFGRMIRRLRTEAGKTQRQLGAAMADAGFFAWSHATVCGLEGGGRRTSHEERATLLSILAAEPC